MAVDHMITRTVKRYVHTESQTEEAAHIQLMHRVRKGQ